MSKVIGTLVIPFGESVTAAGGSIVAEWDDTMNVSFTAGRIISSFMSLGVRHFVVSDGATVRILTATDIKSQFLPGEKAYLLIHTDAKVRIVNVLATHGVISRIGPQRLSRSEDIGIPLADEAHALQYLPATVPDIQFLGNTGREVEWVEREIYVGAGEFPCLARVNYQVDFTRYAIQTPKVTLAKDETYPIMVYLYYEEDAA